MFRALDFEGFAPFGRMRLDFPPVENKPDDLAEVHVFTGINGTGKTRLLCVLAAMLGNLAPLQKRTKGMHSNAVVNPSQGGTFFIHGNGGQWTVHSSFVNEILAMPAFAYNGLAYVSDASVSVMAGIPKPERSSCLAFSRPDAHSRELLQAVANLKVQSAMDLLNEGRDAKPTRAIQLIQGIERTLGEITGQPFRFDLRTHPQPALSVKWGNLESLPFDLLPDGLRSIIGWLVDAVVMMDAWLQGNGNVLKTEAIFLLDEIESHLHPTWQRRILPAFQRLFPKAQIIVATHSPFVISSLTHGWIHQLVMDENRNAVALKPQPASSGESYIAVLEDIMGLKEWYGPETEQLLSEFRQARDNAYRGSAEARNKAIELARKIGSRSAELDYMMGQELHQMERQLSQPAQK